MKNIEKIIRKLINELNHYTKLYDEGKSPISDKAWDDLYFYLESLENQHKIYFPDSPTQSIEYNVLTALRKIEHNHLMLSLDKTKNLNEIKAFIKKYSSICMGKMDGLTCSLRYIDGELVSAETRGNGIIGEDIFYNIVNVKNVPKRINYKKELIVDGEIICKYDDFEPFAEEYKNPRNFAAGSIRLLDSKECEKRHLSFIAWDWIDSPLQTLGESLVELGKLGFTTVPFWDGIEAPFDDLDIIIDFVKNSCIKENLPIDGLVFKYDRYTDYWAEGKTDHHFKGGLAYKFYDESVETILRDIEWSMGRTGCLTPVGVFDSVDIDGSEICRANLHNYSIMKETLHSTGWKGQKVYVAKMNMIIPQIVEADEDNGEEKEYFDYPTVCPVCGKTTEKVIEESGTINIYCTNPDCEGKFINHIAHYCDMTKGMKIKGLSKATLEKLSDWGWLNSITDLYKLNFHREEWMKKPGFGQRSVDNLLAAIENSKTCELWQVISAIGCPLIGVTASKQLADEFSTWANFYNSIQENFIYSTLPNFGYEMDRAIHEFNKWEELNDIIINFNLQIKEPKEKTNKLEGITVVITGSLKTYKNRNLFKEAIEAAGGKVAGSVSGNTDYLINNDTTSQSTKNLNAKKLGIDIISEENFIQKFLT